MKKNSFLTIALIFLASKVDGEFCFYDPKKGPQPIKETDPYQAKFTEDCEAEVRSGVSKIPRLILITFFLPPHERRARHLIVPV